MNPSSQTLTFRSAQLLSDSHPGPPERGLDQSTGEMAITMGPQGQGQVTTLTGELPDQAALMGVLSPLYDMGFPLLKVERLGSAPG